MKAADRKKIDFKYVAGGELYGQILCATRKTAKWVLEKWVLEQINPEISLEANMTKLKLSQAHHKKGFFGKESNAGENKAVGKRKTKYVID